MVHFDAHADTADTQFGQLAGHGTPMRRLIESGAVRGDRFLQIGLRGYWPEPETLAWMADQGMRSYEMTELVGRGLDVCLGEAFALATDECDGVFLSVDVDVVDPGSAPGTGTPEPGGLTPRQLLDAVRRVAMELPVAGVDIVEVSPPYDHAEVTAYLANRVALEIMSGLAWRRAARWPGPRFAVRTRPCSTVESRCARRPVRRSRSGQDGQDGHQERRSTIMAMPWPPPTHIDSSPMVLSVSSSALSSVVMMRAPVWPKGWPRAMAPPRTLSFS